MIIVGAGLAGLLAAHAWPMAQLLEAAPRPSAAHQALLRFRSDAVARLTGIEFRPVTVRKGIFWEGAFHQPNISLANAYSQKCLGSIQGDRSIWNIEPVKRFIAPESFYDELLEVVGSRISWASPFDFDRPAISTAPLDVTLSVLEPEERVEFKRAPIQVQRFRLQNCDVHQTVYFPTDEHTMYRASITGSMLIVEHASAAAPTAGEQYHLWMSDLCVAFNLFPGDLEPLSAAKQSYGKIAPIPDSERKRLLFQLTQRHQIYSLGRFATWRNILLDDVVDDIAVIKRLMRVGAYDNHKALA